MRLRWTRSREAAPHRYWWLGALTWQRPPEVPATMLLVCWPRLLALLLGVLVLGWGGAAALVDGVLHSRDYPSVRYVDVVLPWRWPNVRRAQADDLVRQAREQTERKDDLKAVWALRAAVRMDPHNREASFLLGQIYLRSRMPGDALDQLVAGLDAFEPDRAYLELLFEAALAADDLETILAVTDRYWRAGWGRTDQANRVMLASRRGLALLYLNRWEDAVAWAREVRLAKQAPITLIDVEAYALLKLGRVAEAQALMAQVPMDFARQHPYLIHFFAEVLYELGDKAACRKAMQLYVELGRGSPEPMLAALDFFRSKPDLVDDYRSGLADFYARFGGNAEALTRLAAQLLAQHDTDGLANLSAFARRRALDARELELAEAESLVYGGRLQEAVALIERQPAYPPESLAAFKLELLRRVTGSLISPMTGATQQLHEFLAGRRLPLADSLALADLLEQRGLFEDEGKVLDGARLAYPRSHRVAERLEQFRRLGAGLRGVRPSGSGPGS